MKNKKNIYLRFFLIFIVLILPFMTWSTPALPIVLPTSNQANNQQNSQEANYLANNQAPREVTIDEMALLDEEPPVLPSTTDEPSFFKVYEEPDKLDTAPNPGQDLSQMGTIAALKISGLPLVENPSSPLGFKLFNLFVNELTIKDQNDFNVAYTVDYLRAINVNVPEWQPTFDKSALANLNDGDLDSQLQITNVAAPQAVEINILLDEPTILSNILLALNTQGKLAWDHIGSIEFLSVDGSVYRQDHLLLADHQISTNDNGNNYNFSLISQPSAWTIFSPSQEDNDFDLFMWSYAQDTFSTPNTIAYFGDLMPNRSITPILVSSTTAFKQKMEDHSILEQETLLGHPSREQQLAFLKTIDDSAFWDNLLRTIDLSHENKDNLTIEAFDAFDQSFKNGNSRSWNLKIIFKGDGSTLDTNSLQNLEFLGTLKEINVLEFVSNIATIEAFSYTLNLDQMSWITNMKKLSRLAFKGDKGPDTILVNSALMVYGDLEKWTYFINSSIHYLDLTAFRPFIDIENSYLIDQMVDNSWIALMPAGFTAYLPNTLISGSITSSIKAIFDVTEVKEKTDDNKYLLYDYLTLVKIIATPFNEPQLYVDSEGHYQVDPLNVNGEEIPAKLMGGTWYWDFKLFPDINPQDIVWADFSKQFYFTSNNPHDGFEEDELMKLSVKGDYENLPPSNIDLIEPGRLTIGNKFLLDDFITIDEKQYFAKVIDGNLFWDYDLTTIKYGYKNKNTLENHYFTSLDNLINLVGVDNLTDLYVFEIDNNTTDDYRTMYYDFEASDLTVKDVDLNSEKNEIWIDGKLYNDWIIKEGYIVWNFDQETKIENIKYINDKGAYFTKSTNENGQVVPRLTSVIPHLPYSVIPTKNAPLNDPGIIQDPKDINKTIFIDEQEILVTLRNGFLYWNFDIEKIQYEAYDPIRKTTVYYTLFNQIPDHIPLQNITSVAQAAARNIPNNAIFPILNDKPGVIKIETKEYESIFAFGKWYWDIPKEELVKVRYKDNNNVFYNDLTILNFAKSGMTEVFLPDIESLIVEIDQFETQFPVQLSTNNFSQIHSGYTIDNQHKDFIIIKNQVYFAPEDWARMNYVYVHNNEPYELYTSLEGLSSEKINFLFSKSLFTNKVDVLEKAIIKAPESLDDILKVIDENGEVHIVEIVSSNDKFYYNDLEELLQIKYVNEDGIYFTALQSDYIDSIFTSVDLFASHIDQLAHRESDVYKKQLEAKNLISEILVISASTSVGIIMIIIAVVRLTSNGKRR